MNFDDIFNPDGLFTQIIRGGWEAEQEALLLAAGEATANILDDEPDDNGIMNMEGWQV